MAEATLTPAEPFYRLPTCTDLDQVEAAALILGAPVATLYESVGDYASLIGKSAFEMFSHELHGFHISLNG